MTDYIDDLFERICSNINDKLVWIEIESIAINGDSEERLQVSENLAQIHCVQTEKILIEMLKDKERIIRASACDSLYFSNSLEVLKHLLKMISDKTVLVRGYAFLSIGDVYCNLKEEKEIHPIIDQIIAQKFDIEQSEWVKICIARTAFLMGNTSHLTYLLNSIHSKYYKNRCLAINLFKDLPLSTNDKSKLIKTLKCQKKNESVYAVSHCINDFLNK